MTIHFLYCWKYDVSLHLVFKLFFVTPRKTITTSMNCARVWGDRGVKSPSPSHQDPGYASRLCFKVQDSLFKDRFGKILLDLGNNSSLAKVRKIPFLLNEKSQNLSQRMNQWCPCTQSYRLDAITILRTAVIWCWQESDMCDVTNPAHTPFSF